MTENKPRERMRFFWFDVSGPNGPAPVMWDQPGNRGFDYRSLDDWTGLAKQLEAAKFDGLFWADTITVHAVYNGPDDLTSRDTGIRKGVAFPTIDPACLAAGVASATQKLGLIISSHMISKPPFTFAREIASLDHLTKGRIGWNIVTSFQLPAWQNTGHAKLAGHGDRYDQAEEYTQVVYRLLEGSWEADAAVRDYATRVFADPRKVHLIEPVPGEYGDVVGPNACEPSPQRVPFLFQAGSSSAGRAFAARNAEAIFQVAPTPVGARKFVDDVARQMTGLGRDISDLLVFGAFPCVFGATEEEARRKDEELWRYVDEEHLKAFYSSVLNFDLGLVDVDTPIGELDTDGAKGQIRQVVESLPNKSLSFRDYYLSQHNSRFVGTGEQFADHLEAWRDAGVLGVNLMALCGKSEIGVFAEHIAPVLQARGLMQSDYGDYPTLRERMFDGSQGPFTNDRHPSSKYRRGCDQDDEPQMAAAAR